MRKRNTLLAMLAVCGSAYLARAEESYKTDDFNDDPEQVLLARMIWGEGRNVCSEFEQGVIGQTAINRARDGKKWNGSTVKGALLTKWQYSCFWDKQREKLMNPEAYDAKSFQTALRIAKDVLDGKYEQTAQGATHYHTPAVSPNWASSSQMQRINIGNARNLKHIFYREK